MPDSKFELFVDGCLGESDISWEDAWLKASACAEKIAKEKCLYVGPRGPVGSRGPPGTLDTSSGLTIGGTLNVTSGGANIFGEVNFYEDESQVASGTRSIGDTFEEPPTDSNERSVDNTARAPVPVKLVTITAKNSSTTALNITRGRANISGSLQANSANITTSLKATSATISGSLQANSANITTSLTAQSATISGNATANKLIATTNGLQVTGPNVTSATTLTTGVAPTLSDTANSIFIYKLTTPAAINFTLPDGVIIGQEITIIYNTNTPTYIMTITQTTGYTNPGWNIIRGQYYIGYYLIPVVKLYWVGASNGGWIIISIAGFNVSPP